MTPEEPAGRVTGGARMRAAVIGRPVAHSLSPVLHRAAHASLGLDHWAYERRELAPEALRALLAEVAGPAGAGPVWAGLSVTMPHKQAVIGMLDVVDPLARTVGAVNTVVAQRSGRGAALLAGFNTDVAGIVGALTEIAPETTARRGTTALVLGSGATACSSLAALGELGAGRIRVAARNHAGPGRALAAAQRMGLEVEALSWRPEQPASNLEVAAALAEADLVVSTVTAGASDPVALALRQVLGRRPVRTGAALLDVVYDPWPTALAARWERAGGRLAPGWLMLLHQAVPQVRLLTGRLPCVEHLRRAVVAALDEDRAGAGVQDSATAPGAPGAVE